MAQEPKLSDTEQASKWRDGMMQYQKIYPPPCKEKRHGEIKTLERATKYGFGRKCEDPTVTSCRAFRK
jgi:hypothetical protein